MTEGNWRGKGIKHVPPGEGMSMWVFGGLVTFYALGEDTGGAFTLLEEHTSPETGALPHVHHEEDQAFFVLEGEHEFVCDGQAFVAEAGSYVYAARGVVHSFTNIGANHGRILVLSTPAGGTENFFFEVGEPATDKTTPPPTSVPLEVGELREIARKHGSDIDTMALLERLSAENSPPEENHDRSTTSPDEAERG